MSKKESHITYEDKKMLKNNYKNSIEDMIARLERLEAKVFSDKVETETVSYPVAGEKPQVWGNDIKCLELKCGLKIAMEDYWEIDENGKKKTVFTQGEAIAIEEKTNGKWRIPTMAEWAQIVEELGMKDGNVDRDTFVGALNLTEDGGGWGFYWSSTVATPGTYGYSLDFGSGGVWPASQYYRGYGGSVRCVVNYKNPKEFKEQDKIGS